MGRKRVRGAIVLTSVPDDYPTAALVSMARRYGVRIIGPGSMGVFTTAEEAPLLAHLAPGTLKAGPVGVSMQSGSLGASFLELARRLDLGVSSFVSLGDKADISGNDLLQFWDDDARTHVIAMYTETFGNPRRFARIARRVARRRPSSPSGRGTGRSGPTPTPSTSRPASSGSRRFANCSTPCGCWPRSPCRAGTGLPS